MSRSSDVAETGESVAAAVDAFRRGTPVCIHDAADREGETDLVYPAGAVSPEAVARLRNDAGGLVCVALGDAVAEEAADALRDNGVDLIVMSSTGERSAIGQILGSTTDRVLRTADVPVLVVMTDR